MRNGVHGRGMAKGGFMGLNHVYWNQQDTDSMCIPLTLSIIKLGPAVFLKEIRTWADIIHVISLLSLLYRTNLAQIIVSGFLISPYNQALPLLSLPKPSALRFIRL